jgi:molecular chaperone DnaK (HSP70)
LKIAANSFGENVTPSIIGYCGAEVLVGKAALLKQNRYIETTVHDAKSLLGLTYEEAIQSGILDSLHYKTCS